MISRKVARDYAKDKGKPRKVGDTINIGGKAFTIVGLYETGSMIFDTVIVMDIATARELLNVSKETVSSYYVESDDPTRNDAISAAIKKAMPGVEARSMNEFLSNFGALMGQVDKLLLMTVSLALLVGVVGIINTMLMSTSERFVEFGVLRTNGWSRGNLLALVTLESAYLGLLSGVVGCVLAVALVAVINRFTTGRRHPVDDAPVAVRAGDRPVGRHRDARRPLSRLARRGSRRWTRSGSGRIRVRSENRERTRTEFRVGRRGRIEWLCR